MIRQLTREQAEQVYAILVDECGADPWPYAFVHTMTKPRELWTGGREYRFCGSLGFGGKAWLNNGRVYVTCYREDETPERLDTIIRANRRINLLLGQPVKERP